MSKCFLNKTSLVESDGDLQPNSYYLEKFAVYETQAVSLLIDCSFLKYIKNRRNTSFFSNIILVLKKKTLAFHKYHLGEALNERSNSFCTYIAFLCYDWYHGSIGCAFWILKANPKIAQRFHLSVCFTYSDWIREGNSICIKDPKEKNPCLHPDIVLVRVLYFFLLKSWISSIKRFHIVSLFLSRNIIYLLYHILGLQTKP